MKLNMLLTISASLFHQVYTLEKNKTNCRSNWKHHKVSVLSILGKLTCRHDCGCHTFVELVCKRRTAVCLTPAQQSGRNPSSPL